MGEMGKNWKHLHKLVLSGSFSKSFEKHLKILAENTNQLQHLQIYSDLYIQPLKESVSILLKNNPLLST